VLAAHLPPRIIVQSIGGSVGYASVGVCLFAQSQHTGLLNVLFFFLLKLPLARTQILYP